MKPAAALALAAAVWALAAASVAADSFTPVTLKLNVAAVARLRAPLKATLIVTADPGVLDLRDGAIVADVKLTSAECGGDFEHTAGITLLHAPLSPQPDPGEAYSGSARGSGKPPAYGVLTLCVWLEDANEHRVFAHDESASVNVSRACTAAAARYDRSIRARSRAAARLRRAARRACGPGVPL